MQITVVEGDITEQEVDAVVNAANRAMRGGGGVDGAIHRVGGPEVLADCVRRFPDGLATGDAGWTEAGNLPARWVVHVVGPDRNAGETDRSQLVSCYVRALEVADELGVRSIAFPLVGAGVYGWAAAESVAAALEGIAAAEARGSGVEEVRIVAFGHPAYDVVRRAVGGAGAQSRSTR
ncbi:macro domain-containing protein [Nocardioides ochotonae]|uniref:macro domain-containing protein n=1 Tax=Nocardioides ochotonae TaxID=2685869 RepID=UPI0014093817|nr:macro domain-containing protein [Nocardioides ochotonae]